MFKTPTLIFNRSYYLGVLGAHMSVTADFFSNRMSLQEIEATLAHLFARQVRAGQKDRRLGLVWCDRGDGRCWRL